MKLTEILTESEQQRLDELDVGRAIGKGIGAVGKGIGAVAGIPQGFGRAIKKGYKSAVSTIAGDDEPAAGQAQATSAAPQGGGAFSAFKAGLQGKSQADQPEVEPEEPAAPATAKGGGVAAQPSAQAVNTAGPAGTAPAANLSGAAKAAADKTAAVTKGQDAAQAGQTIYAQVKANIDKLDKKGKQRILQLLQKSMAQPAAQQPAQADAGSAAMGQMAKQLSTPAQSSTGGTITQTPTGVKHTAKQPATGPGSSTAGTTMAGQPKIEPDLNAPASGGGAVKQMAQKAATTVAKKAAGAAKNVATTAAKKAAGAAQNVAAKAAGTVTQSGHSTKPSISESKRSIFVQK